MSYSVQHDHRQKPGGPRPCVFTEPPGPSKRAKTWTPTPRVTTTRRGLPCKSLHEREREARGRKPPHTQTPHHTNEQRDHHRGREGRERERERRSARFLSYPDWRSRLWVRTLALCWTGCSVGGHGRKRPGLGGRCKVNPTYPQNGPERLN